MAFSIPTGSEIITRSTQTLKRFPLTMLSAIIGTLIAIYLIEIAPPKMEGVYLTLSKILLSSSLAIFVFTAVRLAGESLKAHWHHVLTLLAVLGMLAYYRILPDTSKEFAVSMIPFRHFFLIVLFSVAFLWAPFVRSDLDNADYWEYSKQILFALVISFLFTLVVILGVNGALFAIQKLFDLHLASKRYFQLDVFVIGIFSVGYFLSQIPRAPLASRHSPKPPRVEKFFTQWLLTPLSGLYFVILYSYTAKVLFTMDWPKGILAWLIVIFSVVAILTYLFWTHFVTEQNSWWRRGIWLAILLQTVMLFVAIGIRIAEYSWTESRYMVFVLGVWLAGVSLYFLWTKQAKIKWIFISISLLIALTQFGPFNAYTVSQNAQTQRLQEMMVELKKHENTLITPLKLRYEISDALSYLENRYGKDSLITLFPEINKEFEKIQARREALNTARRRLEKEGKTPTKEMRAERIALSKYPHRFSRFVVQKLGFEFVTPWEYRGVIERKHPRISFASKKGYIPYSSNTVVDVKGYDYMLYVNMDGYGCAQKVNTKRIDFDDVDLVLRYTNTHQLEITKGDARITIDMKALLKKLIAKHGKRSQSVAQDELILTQENQHMKVKLKLNEITEERYDDNTSIEFNGMLLIGEKLSRYKRRNI